MGRDFDADAVMSRAWQEEAQRLALTAPPCVVCPMVGKPEGVLAEEISLPGRWISTAWMPVVLADLYSVDPSHEDVQDFAGRMGDVDFSDFIEIRKFARSSEFLSLRAQGLLLWKLFSRDGQH